MTLTRTLRLLLACSLLCGSCGNLELDEVGGSSSGGTSGGSVPISLEEALTVAEALKQGEEQDVTVHGYYIGFVNGRSLNQLVVGTSDGEDNTNLVLADEPYYNGEDPLLPVELSTTRGVRAALSTYRHPELYRAHIVLEGVLNRYFGTLGLKQVTAWAILPSDGDNPPDGGDEKDGKDDPDPVPNPNPDPKPEPKPIYPQIDTTRPAILRGL